MTFVEAGLLAVGALSMVEALRRRQGQHRPSGRRIRLPAGDAAGVDVALRLGSRPDVVGRIQDALLALPPGAVGSVVPNIVGIVAGSREVELLLARPVPPPLPWASAAEGFRWRLRPDRPKPTVEGRSEPVPALTPVGRAAGSGDEVLINLEAAGVVSIVGDTGRAAGMMRTMAVGLSSLPWAQAVNLVLVGFGTELGASPNVRTVATLSAILPELRVHAVVMRDLLAGHDCQTTLEARLRGAAADGWPPTVVLCGRPPADEDLADLVSLAVPGAGVAAVVPVHAHPAPGWVVDADATPMTINPLRLAVEPTVVAETELADLGQLLDTAADVAGATVDDAPYGRIQLSVERSNDSGPAGTERQAPDPSNVEPGPAATGRQAPDPPIVEPTEGSAVSSTRLQADGGALIVPLDARAVLQAPEPGRPLSADHVDGKNKERRPAPPADAALEVVAPPVLVRVLGTVEIDGASEFKRAKSRELAVYLALHPNGVGEAEMDEALWPSGAGRLVPSSTRDSTVSVARTALGGSRRLLPAQGLGREKRYQVGTEVGSDFSLFCSLHRRGRAEQAVAPLQAALQLVRGRPFAGVISSRTFTWIHTEGHARHIEAEVGDAADLAATLYLAQDRPLEARWAARRGLAADPLCERLWVRLMEAADDLGESQEVERLMDELDVTLELGGDFSGLHPNTLAAYERHRRRPRRGAKPV